MWFRFLCLEQLPVVVPAAARAKFGVLGRETVVHHQMRRRLPGEYLLLVTPNFTMDFHPEE